MPGGTRAYILLGSNLGDRAGNIELATRLIERRVGRIAARAEFYETPAQGISEAPPFINTAIAVQTELSAHALLDTLLEIEVELGRIRTHEVTSRPIDLDIAFYGDSIIDEDKLIVPHPRLHLRRFALAPLNDIAADHLHPVLKYSVKELLKSCPDQSEVTILSRS